MKKHSFHCPECGAQHTKRCTIAYEQAVIEGPNFDTRRSFASRVSPPAEPSTFPRTALLLLALCLIFAVPLIGLVLAVPCVIGALVFSRRHRKAHSAFLANMELYRRLWVCFDCGHVFQPEHQRGSPGVSGS